MGEVAAPRAAGSLIGSRDITPEELQLAVRNHSMPLEALHYDITPVGLHYLLIHFDIPAVDAKTFTLAVGGRVRKPLRLSIDELRSRPARALAVTLECAGNGRSRLTPRPMSQPWVNEAVGTAEWTGTPLGPILDEAGIEPDAQNVVFTGRDRGVQGGVEQQYERALSIQDATRPEVMLAYAINGQLLPPQHGFPLRLIVPGWYGMTSVKWLRSITLIDHDFEGYQQNRAYRYRMSKDVPGDPVMRILPRALMVPPGVPEYMTRSRFLSPGRVTVEGRAWSGRAPIARVEFSADGGQSWDDAKLEAAPSPFAWRRWAYEWDATQVGEHELCARATDEAGNTQPLEQAWNAEGVQNNAVQRVRAVVGMPPERQTSADSD